MASSAAGKARKPGTRRTLNDIFDVRDTALQTISDIFDALASDKERTDHGVPVEDWVKEIMRLSAEARPSRS